MASRAGGRLTTVGEPLAHSARAPGQHAQTYREHLAGTPESEGVVAGARRRAEAMAAFDPDRARGGSLVESVAAAAAFHDLGKLDPDIQAALRRGRDAKLCWDHVDAGVAHLMDSGAEMAAWLVRAHHAPGLPSSPAHFAPRGVRPGPNFRQLRGVRRDEGVADEEHRRQIRRTDELLAAMRRDHESSVGAVAPAVSRARHGLAMRLALSCLVDADPADTAFADMGWTPPAEPPPRWDERLAALDRHVAGLGRGHGARDDLRRRFYDACRERAPDRPLMACEGPVGIGKTTAVTAFLIRRAIAVRARRLFIVAPFTAILSQTSRVLRHALVLEGERDRPDAIVAEHHHRADFDDPSSRDLATLWTAPIVLTTAVQFFETLAACDPSALRKLHALPGSVIFLDEAHAALPTQLWPQNWRWIRELSADWACSFVLASGSLARFWELDDVAGEHRCKLDEIGPPGLAEPLRRQEARRLSYATLSRLDGPDALAAAVLASPGPRLLVMNTVQSAAVMARTLRAQGRDVLHISTALAPAHRAAILAAVSRRLAPGSGYPADWTLVATSMMEAGVDLSFRTCFRERFSTASLIQIGGRSNRHFEWPDGAMVYDFVVSATGGLKAHPAALVPAAILERLFADGMLSGNVDPADLVTRALRMEMRRRRQSGANPLVAAERDRRYPDAASEGRVIDAETCLVVVEQALRDRIVARDRIPTRELLGASVQLWTQKVGALRLEALPGRREVFWWPYRYDPAFLGYMEGALGIDEVARGEAILF